LAAYAKEFQRRVMALEGLDELRTIHFTGSLPGGDQDSHGGIVAGTQRLARYEAVP
jgi:hypothetical protein